MVQKWITKKDGMNESKHVKIETSKKTREVMVSKMEPSAGQLEKQAWAILGDLSKVTTVDQLLLSMKKYSGTLGNYSGENSMLIYMQNPNATIVRSATEWKYFGKEVKPGAHKMSVLFPIGIPQKAGPGKLKDFMEKKRGEGLSDEAIAQLVKEKFNLEGDTAYHFGVGSVYDIRDTEPIPGKPQKREDETIKAQTFYKDLKEIAKKHYIVQEDSIAGVHGARGYTAHSSDGEGQRIVVMKVPGEDENVLHTLIHEMSHARLDHLNRKDIPRGIAESEAELSTYLVGAHFGFDFKDDSAAYIKGWLDDPQNKGKKLDKENLDRVLNNARWLINQITNKIGEAQ
jgi:hypothetical protein